MMRRTTPGVNVYTTPVREAAPQAIGYALAFARLLGRQDLRGQNGATRLGEPAIGTRRKFGGYGNSPQLFLGYDPAKVAAGAFRGAPGALPSTSSPTTALNSPLQRAMATVSAQQGLR